jgi:GntR family transcriptional repressor for pyruvate dehydrogenase complex
LQSLFKPLKTESLTDVFVQRFGELILSGQIAVGSRLPSERELAKMLAVSRPVVHAGLVELASRGLVTITPRRGAYVNDYRETGSLSLLMSIFHYKKGRLDPEILYSLFSMRTLVEVETARLAALHRTGEQLQKMEEILASEEEADPGDIALRAELYFQFHHRIAMASANLVYPMLLNSFKEFYLNMTSQAMEAGIFQLDYHRRLLAAIRNRQAVPAAETMRELLENGKERMYALHKAGKGGKERQAAVSSGDV